MLSVGDKVELTLNSASLLKGSMDHLIPEYKDTKVQGIVRYITGSRLNAGIELDFLCVTGYDPTGCTQGNSYGRGLFGHCVYASLKSLTKIVETPPTPKFNVEQIKAAKKAAEFSLRYGGEGRLSIGIDPVINNVHDWFKIYDNHGWMITDHSNHIGKFEPNYLTPIDDETPLDTYTLHQLAQQTKEMPIGGKLSWDNAVSGSWYGMSIIKPRRVGQSHMYDSLKAQAYWERQVTSNGLSQNAASQRGLDFHKQALDLSKFYQTNVLFEDDHILVSEGQTMHQILGLVPEVSIAVQDEEVLLCL